MAKPVLFGASKAWHRASNFLGTRTSLRESHFVRLDRPVVVAIGGNSFKGQEAATARNIVEIAAQVPTVITHGNGPQVGHKLQEAERTGQTKLLADCTFETQIEMGRALKDNIQQEQLPYKLRRKVEIEVIPTRVIVDEHDPAFLNPTKFIGDPFPLEQFRQNSQPLTEGRYAWFRGNNAWIMKEVTGKPGIYRRVVASPKPIQIHPEDMQLIEDCMAAGRTVIAVGGGGVPIFPNGKKADAVIDKDLATALLCRQIEARQLIISTGVKYVAHQYGTPEQVDIQYYWLKQALGRLKSGEFKAGDMGEKIEAAINALRFGVNEVLITEPTASWAKHEGTLFTRGPDLTGRFYNLARNFGLVPDTLQRWLVA